MRTTEKLKGKRGFELLSNHSLTVRRYGDLLELQESSAQNEWKYESDSYIFELLPRSHSVWMKITFPTGQQISVRCAYTPYGDIEVADISKDNKEIRLIAKTKLGTLESKITIEENDFPYLHILTKLTPSVEVKLEHWPRDLLIHGMANDDSSAVEGYVYSAQKGSRTGKVYFSITKPKAAVLFYVQNLTALNDYADQTQTMLGDAVGGNWPELGFMLPTSNEPLKKGIPVILSDVHLALSDEVPADDLEMGEQYLSFMSLLYSKIPRPNTQYVEWHALTPKVYGELEKYKECWKRWDRKKYLNAYVSDFDKPPESMVQLTVLLPLLEFAEWGGERLAVTETLLKNIENFFDPTINCFVRWPPDAKEDTAQSDPRNMDSWYLYHILYNIGRLAEQEHGNYRKLYEKSLVYAIKVAHKFNYHWPVFFNLDSLKIERAETEEGKGGETDVACLYTKVMLQAWKMTNNDIYLEEAKKAADSLTGIGLALFYQANSTLFGAGAMLDLWKVTNDEKYLRTSHLCLANVFDNTWLWECEYGNARHYSTFFSLFPLRDATYIAAYEEIECLAAFHEYLQTYILTKKKLPSSLEVLIPEYIRYMVYRASFYYPQNLPPQALTKEPKTGQIIRNLWMPVEDLRDGAEQSGMVGQEVYGASIPWTITTRHYWKVPEQDFLIYTDYPVAEFSQEKNNTVSFKLLGDQNYTSRIRIIGTKNNLVPVSMTIKSESKKKPAQSNEQHLEYTVPGDSAVTISWEEK